MNGGFTIVSAIFLLVVLAALGAAMLNFATVQHAGSQLDVQGARAYQAARAGLEWGLYRQSQQGACAAGPVSFPLPAGSTLDAFTVSVSCESRVYGSAAALDGIRLAPEAPPIGIFHVTAIACNRPVAGNCPGAAGTKEDYVERRLDVTFRQ